MTKIRSERSSRIQDRRGQGGGAGGLSFPGLGGGGGGLGIPMKAGGGILGLIVVLAAVLLPKLLGGGSTQSITGAGTGALTGQEGSSDVVDCPTEIEQILCGAVEDVSDYWVVEYPERFGQPYREADTVFFSGGTNTGCGQASAQMGPFYCPADELVYFDLDFLVQMQQEFGAVGDLAAQYIVAHEYGHHVQNVLGVSGQVSRAQQQNPGQANALSVALELQADCLAGAWASSADERGQLEPGEISEAVDAAAAVGDDRIQSQAGMRVNPETFTHGTSEQRVQWFRRGYDTGDPNQCNTLAEL